MLALVDMQSFFPELKDKPVAVTNGDTSTTIISSCYIDRGYDVKTGMHLKEAMKLCPKIIQRSSRPEHYSQISEQIMLALHNVSSDIEVFSIDECFIDLKPCLSIYKSVEDIATLIIKTVFDASGGINCSIGISEGKITSKFCT